MQKPICKTILAVIVAASSVATAAEASKTKPADRMPNVIIILADDLGCGDMSLYDGWIKTPRIDQMAREGVRFTDFHSNSSVCSPTRVALMTGRYQQRVGIVDVIVGYRDKEGLEPSELTIPRLMKDAGYKTAIFGKWHCGTHLRHNPTNHGFDEYVGFLIGGSDYHKHGKWMDGTEVKEQKGYSTHIITDLPDRRVFFGYEPKLGTAMRDGHWKMQTTGDVVELYDLSRDIRETTNVADEYPERSREMKAAIDKWKAEVTLETTSQR
jgi:hypothetical protein